MYKRVWGYRFWHFGFETLLLIYGTEEEAGEYLKSELGYTPAYSALTDKEEEAARSLGMKIYLAPAVKH